MKQQGRIVLASGSPRRKELLADAAGLVIEVCESRIPEIPTSTDVFKVPAELSLQKMLAVKDVLGADFQGWIVSADTVVICDNLILGKPRHLEESKTFLHRLSGRTHQVLTSFRVLRSGGEMVEQTHETRVCFRKLWPSEIDDYAHSGEGMDKAGSYGIQGRAMGFVSKIEGSYTNVVGLPLSELILALHQLGAIKG